ncbi:MAG: hypothetical protein HYY24_05805 [Verrucomicrobia bacterium]|nr:hypothetical protein [Verrucomicrobiota bacterium]
MNLLDENIPLDQRDLLRSWGIHGRLIGHDISESSVSDDNIITLLHRLKQPTLFTRDEDFFQRRLCHLGYALIWLDAAPAEAAMFRPPLSATFSHPDQGPTQGPRGAGASRGRSFLATASGWAPVPDLGGRLENRANRSGCCPDGPYVKWRRRLAVVAAAVFAHSSHGPWF